MFLLIEDCPLSATHRYSTMLLGACSVRLTWISLSPPGTIIEKRPDMGSLSTLDHVMLGVGRPEAVHSRVTFEPGQTSIINIILFLIRTDSLNHGITYLIGLYNFAYRVPGRQVR